MAKKVSNARDVAHSPDFGFAASFSSNAARFIAMAANGKPPRSTFAQALLAWQRHSGRHDLPWQTRPIDPYRVWLSEIMLQQTQVKTAIPYFERFIARFPRIEQLAMASEHDVLALWSGLGYYQRARNLLKCAQEVVRSHRGVFPRTAIELQALPGIGPSTAAAIASTVFNERVAILDGNVKRVLARVTCADPPWGSPALERELLQAATHRLPVRPSDMPRYTQAIMDLGALVCTPKVPRCTACPVTGDCGAFQRKETTAFPRQRVKKAAPVRNAYWCVLVHPHYVWLVQRPTHGVWPGLWQPWPLDPDALPAHWGETAQHLKRVDTIHHAFSHYRLLIEAGIVRWPYATTAPRGAPAGLTRFTWAEALCLPLPAPVAKLLATLCPSGKASGGAPRRRSRP
jgi:A/G-specific adenine glycosylase